MHEKFGKCGFTPGMQSYGVVHTGKQKSLWKNSIDFSGDPPGTANLIFISLKIKYLANASNRLFPILTPADLRRIPLPAASRTGLLPTCAKASNAIANSMFFFPKWTDTTKLVMFSTCPNVKGLNIANFVQTCK